MNTTVKPPKAHLTVGQKIIAAVIVTFIVFMCICFTIEFVEAISTPKFTDLSGISYEELDPGEYYYIENALIFDAYAKITQGPENDAYGITFIEGSNTMTFDSDKKTKEMYYVVMAKDKNDAIVYMSLRILPKDDMYEKLLEYHYNINMGIGDLVIPLYCKCSGISDLDSGIRRYYKNSYDEFTEIVQEDYAEYTEFNFDYIATTETEFIDSVKSEAFGLCVMFSITICILIAVLIIYVRRKKKKAPAPSVAASVSPANENVIAAVLDSRLRKLNAEGRTDSEKYAETADILLYLPMYAPCDPASNGVSGAFRFMPFYRNGTDCAAVYTTPDKIPAESAASTRRLYPSEYIRMAAALGKSVLINPGFGFRPKRSRGTYCRESCDRAGEQTEHYTHIRGRVTASPVFMLLSKLTDGSRVFFRAREISASCQTARPRTRASARIPYRAGRAAPCGTPRRRNRRSEAGRSTPPS